MNDKQNFKFSIITPTHNRSALLKRLWHSLQIQKDYISEWIVIDDRSNDNTKELILELKKESDLKIIYEYNKYLGGMTHAINIGLKYVKADYFFKIDSDDYLRDNSLEIIYNSIHKIKTSELNHSINAFSFLTSDPKGKIINKFNKLKSIGNYFEENIITLDYISARYMNLISGDLLDVFNSYPLINQFRYPVFKDERHCPSGYISYFNADYLSGEVAYVLENVLVKDYQCDGITAQRKIKSLNVPSKSLKSYLISNLWLLNITSDKPKALFYVLKQIFKIYLMLFSSLLVKLINLIFKNNKIGF